tara:strand:+ start:168 stop:326 length:159 start_codon:yes stop_codon:yes gene_type:complete
MNTNTWLFIIGAKTNTPLEVVKEIFKTEFDNSKECLQELEEWLIINKQLLNK